MTEQINFESLNMILSDSIQKYSIEQQKLIFDYLNEMDEHHRKAYSIAYNHLGTSFNIARSNGFKEWLKSKSNTF
jgi:hypothetical protein